MIDKIHFKNWHSIKTYNKWPNKPFYTFLNSQSLKWVMAFLQMCRKQYNYIWIEVNRVISVQKVKVEKD